MRRVEREVARLELVDREAVVGTAVLLAVPSFLEGGRFAVARGGRDEHLALPEPQCRLDRVGQPSGVRICDGLARLGIDRSTIRRALHVVGRLRVADDVAIDDDLDRMALVLVELGRVGDVDHLAVDPDADEALPPGPIEDAVALRLAVLDQRPEDEQPGTFRECEDLVDDLLDALTLDRVAVGAVRDPDPREEQAQVVVDLRHGPDGRARIPRSTLLVDRDGRREPIDLVDVRFLHLTEELPSVGAQALDIAALTLGVDGVERQAGLAAPGQAGDDHEPIARERHVDVLEVVFARTAHDELILGHDWASVTRPSEIERVFYAVVTRG